MHVILYSLRYCYMKWGMLTVHTRVIDMILQLVSTII